MLQDHRGSTGASRSDGSGPVDKADGRLESREQPHECRLTRAVATDDRDELSRFDREVDVRQGVAVGSRIPVADQAQGDGQWSRVGGGVLLGPVDRPGRPRTAQGHHAEDPEAQQCGAHRSDEHCATDPHPPQPHHDLEGPVPGVDELPARTGRLERPDRAAHRRFEGLEQQHPVRSNSSSRPQAAAASSNPAGTDPASTANTAA